MAALGAALIAALALLAAACSSPEAPMPAGPATPAASTGPTKDVIPPDTPAGAQLEWLIAAMAHLPMSDAEVRAHVDAGYLAMFSPAALNQWLQTLNEWVQAGTGAKLISIKVAEPSMVVAIVSAGGAGPRARVGLTVDSRGLIGDLDISPAIAGPVPDTWAAVDAALRSVAPQVRLLVANVGDGSSQPVRSIDPNTPEPFGSVLKLYVLLTSFAAPALEHAGHLTDPELDKPSCLFQPSAGTGFGAHRVDALTAQLDQLLEIVHALRKHLVPVIGNEPINVATVARPMRHVDFSPTAA